MKSRRILISLFVPLVLLLIAVVGLTYAQEPEPPQSRAPEAGMGTAFTYQGQLELDREPVNEACEMVFYLYDDATAGGQIGVPITETVVISDGLFTQPLDFGAAAFTGDARWLGIEVMCPGDADFTDLGRQALTAAPYAHYALSSGALQGYPVTTTEPISGQVLAWNGTAWGPEDTPFWSLSGNSGTNPAGQFLGTTDDVALELRVNDSPALRLEPDATSPNVIGGFSDNGVASGVHGATIGGGGSLNNANDVTDHYGTVGGGQNNRAGNGAVSTGDRPYATVGGGTGNRAGGDRSTIGGGSNNTANGSSATIGGGSSNTASGVRSTVAGGAYNTASGDGAFVGGGGYDGSTTSSNLAQAPGATIGGGLGNVVSETANYGVVVGGIDNTAGGNRAFIGGGMLNSTSPLTGYAAVVTGRENEAAGQFSFIGNGYQNRALGFRSVIVGGETNTTHGWFDFIASGDENEVWGGYASIGGGYRNVITGEMTVIGGGGYHIAEGEASTISGGKGNTTSADYATVPGGWNAAATHYGELAYANGSFDERGDAQTSVYVLRRNVVGGTPRTLFLDPGSNARITLPVSRTMTFDILVTAAADNGQAASYQYVGGIKHTAVGGTALIGPVQTVMELEDESAWSVDIEADDSNDALRIRVTGAADRTIHWVATVRTVETTMP